MSFQYEWYYVQTKLIHVQRNCEEDEVNEWVLLIYFSYVLVRNERKHLKKVSKELVILISTQPVMIIHDGFVLDFYHHFKLNQDNITWTELVMIIVYIWIPCLFTLIMCTYGYHAHVDIVFR